MGRKPIVAISGSNRGNFTSFLLSKFLLSLYDIDSVFITPNRFKKDIKFDGLLLLGGADINPRLYNQKRDALLKKIDTKRDSMELYLLKKAYSNNIPIFGICRGMQFINIFFGGTLHKDLKPIYPKHYNTNLVVKEVKIIPHTKLYNIIRAKKIKVNSLHHQGIKDLGKNLRISAYDINKIPYAIESQDENFLLGVQWHPEYIPYAWHSRKLFKAFSQAIKKEKKR